MASLLDVPLRTSEAVDQEIAKPLLGGGKFVRRIHFPENGVVRDLPIKSGDQTDETFLADH
jgi:hypothetical protein